MSGKSRLQVLVITEFRTVTLTTLTLKKDLGTVAKNSCISKCWRKAWGDWLVSWFKALLIFHFLFLQGIQRELLSQWGCPHEEAGWQWKRSNCPSCTVPGGHYVLYSNWSDDDDTQHFSGFQDVHWYLICSRVSTCLWQSVQTQGTHLLQRFNFWLLIPDLLLQDSSHKTEM